MIVIVAVLAAGFVGYQYVKSKMDKIQTTDLNKEKVETNERKEETKEASKGYTTIALFGLDNRKTGYYDRGNSDVIMIMSMNNDTKELQMVSVYRDTYLNIQGDQDSFRKANSAYAYGGPEQAISMLNKNLDLDIDNYVTFDFETVADAIDILGGVDIEIESQEELNYLNKYIDHTDGILGTSTKHVYNTGKQTLSGVQAVAYGRIRYTSGSDFRRAERHRLVLTQLFKKAKKADLAELNSLMDEIFPKIKTDLTQKQILSMVTTVLDYDLKDSRGFPFDKRSTKLSQSVGWVDVPCDLLTNVTELHKYLYSNEKYEPSSTVEEYSDTIVNNTGFTKEKAEDDRFSEIDDFDGKNDTDEKDDVSGTVVDE